MAAYQARRSRCVLRVMVAGRAKEPVRLNGRGARGFFGRAGNGPGAPLGPAPLNPIMVPGQDYRDFSGRDYRSVIRSCDATATPFMLGEEIRRGCGGSKNAGS